MICTFTFQPHFGLILIRLINMSTNPFNRISTPFWSDFNTEEPPMQLAYYWISTPFWSDFNTLIGQIIGSQFDIFQPHFGLILMGQHRWKDKQRDQFQPHFGLILISPILASVSVTTVISTPFWSDFNWCLQWAYEGLKTISTPFWSDFNWCYGSLQPYRWC